MRKLGVLVLAVLLGCAGCQTLGTAIKNGASAIGVRNSHPAWACNDSTAIGLAAAIAEVMGAGAGGIADAVGMGKAACDMEASLVAGSGAQVTITTTTTKAVTTSNAN